MLATRLRKSARLQLSERQVVRRTRGQTRGPITRLVSPSDLGQIVKPFVFLDHAVFEAGDPRTEMEVLWHPHSGIATVTVVLEGSLRYAETTGKSGVVATGGVEWMRAGNGVWHTAQAGEGSVRIFQLWVALPPHLENAHSASRQVAREEIPAAGPARVVLGHYAGTQSPIDAPPMTYLVLSLNGGERWSFQPPTGHEVTWVAVDKGTLRTPSLVTDGELAIFEPSDGPIDFVAEGETVFVLGSAAKHPHDLFLGNYSVHTSAAALQRGEKEIRRVGRRLLPDGTLRPLK